MHTRYFLLVSLIIALLAGLLFLPGLPGEFVFDDIPNIVNNSSIHLAELSPAALYEVLATKQVSGNMRGLPTLTFALDFWRAGGVADPATFKMTNILIHMLTACALAWLFRSLLLIAGVPEKRVMWVAPMLALAWAAHPLQVSAVLYAVQRLQTMGTLFLVLALLAYLQARQAQMQGRSGRTGLLGCLLLWAAAMSCKEDSVLLPAYTLALELTLLRFAAADAGVAGMLRRGYALAMLAGVAVYALWVVPHYWQWEAHAGRDFSTPERLLTQPRVLCMYLWQILLPLPSHMSFYYDWVQPSRGLLQPWTTLPAIALVATLLVLAWRLRHRQPLFALGVFLFFGAHFIASNVVALELAYEHRNHFALIGVVLAVAGVMMHFSQRLQMRSVVVAGVCAAVLLALGGATLLRAHSWSSNVLLAKAGTEAAPSSPRAWIELCDALFIAGGGVNVRGNPNLEDAIAACAAGAESTPDTLNSLALLTVLKTIRGDVSPEDWERFQHRLQTARMSWDNARAPLILTHYASLGVALDKAQVLAALATLDTRFALGAGTLAYIGNIVMDDFAEPELALAYFIKAVERLPAGDPFAWQLGAELRNQGHADLAEAVEKAGLARLKALSSTPESH
ncbi:hypothetical protein OS187_05310 [Xanthomonadaceae bacterium JHOS43]|nr:hypothetical protein [Xanthomonadaceae bacterium JHOS43]